MHATTLLLTTLTFRYTEIEVSQGGGGGGGALWTLYNHAAVFDIYQKIDHINSLSTNYFSLTPFWNTKYWRLLYCLVIMNVYIHSQFSSLNNQGHIHAFEYEVTFLEFGCSNSTHYSSTWLPNDYFRFFA